MGFCVGEVLMHALLFIIFAEDQCTLILGFTLI